MKGICNFPSDRKTHKALSVRRTRALLVLCLRSQHLETGLVYFCLGSVALRQEQLGAVEWGRRSHSVGAYRLPDIEK